MNKWIEQEAEKYGKECPWSNNPSGRADFKAGAQAMLEKVREILEESKADDVGMVLVKAGRESLRVEISNKLNSKGEKA